MIGISKRKCYKGDICSKCGSDVRLVINDKCAKCNPRRIDKSWHEELARKQVIRRRIEEHQNREDDYGFEGI